MVCPTDSAQSIRSTYLFVKFKVIELVKVSSLKH